MAAAKTSESKDDIRWLETRLENVATSKASKEFVISEFSNLKNKIENVKEKVEEVDERSSSPHVCTQTGAFDILQSRISSNKVDINANSGSIKKLYTWQASVGISLLIFFLTIGVAALRYVDKIDFAVQKNSDRMIIIERSIEEDDELSKEELRHILDEALQRNLQ